MKGSNGSGVSLVVKPALCLFLAAVAVFFAAQATLGARDGGEGGAAEKEARIAPGGAIHASLAALLESLAGARTFDLEPQWELAVAGGVFLEEEGGFLYITSNLGRVMAVDASTGRLAWGLNLGAWVSAAPAVQDGVVYVGATDHVLYALDAASGALLWHYTSQGEILAQPVVDGDMIFFTADNDSVYDLLHRLYALDAASGSLLWTYDTESWTPSPPAVGAEAVYLGGYRREVYALDKHGGGGLWSFKTPNIVFSSPQITGERVLFTCIDGWVHALDAGSGAPLWSRKLPGFVWLASLDGSGNLYACSHRDTLTAMAVSSGEELWAFSAGELLACAATQDGGIVCAFEEGGRVYLLDASTGKQDAILRMPRAFTSTPLLKGGHVYCGSSDGFVRAYALPKEM